MIQRERIDYGRAVRMLRSVRRVTGAQLAVSGEFSASHLTLIEQGTRLPSDEIKEKIADGLGMSKDDIDVLASALGGNKKLIPQAQQILWNAARLAVEALDLSSPPDSNGDGD